MPESVQLHQEKMDASAIFQKTYQIKVTIKDKSYTNDLVSITIISTLASAYQIISLSLFLDPADVIFESLYGGESIKVQISLLRELGIPDKTFDLELIYISSDFIFGQKPQDSGASEESIKERTLITIDTLPKNAYKTMATMVNEVFIGKNLRSILTSLASKSGAKLEYDSDGENTNVIEQVCIPPTTFYKVIKEGTIGGDDVFDGYLDQRFGLFNGVAGVFCNYDNTVYIKNLTERIKKGQLFTIYQIASMKDKDNQTYIEKIADEVADGKAFYTHDNLQTDYFANTKFGTMASDITHIVKPADKLYSFIDKKLEDVAKKYGLIHTSQNIEPDLFLNPTIFRKRYINEDTGDELNETLFNSRLSKSLCDLSTISFNIERNLEIDAAFNIGDCIKFKPLSIAYQDFSGNYILFRSEIKLSRKNNWQATGNLTLIRTNKKS